MGWQENYNNKSLSGIEVCDHDGKLMNFINIRHDEILKNKPPHRIQIKLNENAEPILPPPQTFDEIIQAKRRHQMLLYGSGSSSSSAPTAGGTIPPSVATRAPTTSSNKAASALSTSTPRSTVPTTKVPAPSPTTSNPGAASAAATAAAAAASSLAPKDIKAMLKSTPPGHSIVLPDGTVIKKSRRGGARAGAGRKRSRPLPGASHATSSAPACNMSTK